jgi:Tol biopolymer transport system component
MTESATPRMALTVGQRIGVYEVIGSLGAGGMGEVYRARDTRLGRDVALKILPEVFASDPERLARFEREAQALASLNHPHIAAIYGLEESDKVRALVMELVDGQTLAERIDGQPLPVDEALAISRQIADALEAAHEQGIIHRDLKPANIKLTTGGAVKVLDFGLAKLNNPNASNGSNGSNATMSPTLISPAVTTVGLLLGTAAYMAPEQARGRATDRRVDVWAFGCVLFEMLSGRQAFAGSDVTEVLATVLKSDPEWSALPSSTPPRIRAVLERCLQKDPQRRIRDIGDVRLAMDGAFETVAAAVVPASMPAPRKSWRWPAGAALAALAAAALTWSIARPAAVDPGVAKRFSLVLPEGDLLPLASGTMVAVSPDGQTLAYRATRDGMRLFIRKIDQFDATAVGDPNPGEAPFFSDDGQWLAYVVNTVLKKGSVNGGPSETLATLTAPPRGGDWSGGLIALAGSTLGTVPAAGGSVTTLATAPAGRRLWYPQIVAGGKAIIYTSSLGRPDSGDIEVFDVATKTSRKLLPGAAARLVPTGHLVFVRGGALWAVKIDEQSLQVQGTPVPVVEGIRVEAGGAVQYNVARDGTLMYIPGSVTRDSELAWLDRTGKTQPLSVPRRPFFSVRLDRMGARLALDVRDQGTEGGDIYVLPLGRQTPTRVTFDPAEDIQPAWTPDGRLVFVSSRNKTSGLYWQSADGTVTPQKIVTDTLPIDQPAVTPDGKYVVARSGEDIVIADLTGKPNIRKLIESPFRDRNPEVSPNGRWIAYQSDENGPFEIYVRSFPDVSKGKWQVSEQGGSRPVWAPNGGELFYLGTDQTLMSVTFTERDGAFIPSTPQKVVAFPQQAGVAQRTYDVSPDGQRFITIRSDTTNERAQINVVLNWLEELKKRVPAN